MNITLDELLQHTEEEQSQWEHWFAEHGPGPLSIALPNHRYSTLGALVVHAVGPELWFAQWLNRTEITEWWTQPLKRPSEIFALGRSAKRALRQYIAKELDWERTVELQSPGRTFRVSARTAVARALLHEMRHWSQFAMIVRQHGMAPPGHHDFICGQLFE